jgi:hypothetical protein
MTADDVPRQRSRRDRHIATVRDLVNEGVLGPTHRRWPAMCRAARALHCRPEDAIYRIRDGIWSRKNHPDTQTPADAIREAATR